MSARYRELRMNHQQEVPLVRYFDEEFDKRYGRIVRRNGDLVLVEDDETGSVRWLAPFEVEEKTSGPSH